MTTQSQHNSFPLTSLFTGVFISALLGCAFAWWSSPAAFHKAWLSAAMLPWSISVGSLTLMLITCLTGGRWGATAWPWLSVCARSMPLVALIFVPWLVGAFVIYPWANSDLLMRFENTENRRWLYKMPFFVGRTLFYFATWIILSGVVAGLPWSAKSNPGKIWGGQAMAGIGLIVILLTVTWAGIDWIMSFDPFFTSTLFGALIGIGTLLAALSATVVARASFQNLDRSDVRATSDLSNLLLAFLMLWAYFSFAHFLIMWTGDLPLEAGFYAARRMGVWRWIVPAMAFGGFFVPFFCLFSRDFKRSPQKVAKLALGLLVVRMVELWWMIMPAGGEDSTSGLHWAIVPTMLAVSGIYYLSIRWLVTNSRLDWHTAAEQPEAPHA